MRARGGRAGTRDGGRGWSGGGGQAGAWAAGAVGTPGKGGYNGGSGTDARSSDPWGWGCGTSGTVKPLPKIPGISISPGLPGDPEEYHGGGGGGVLINGKPTRGTRGVLSSGYGAGGDGGFRNRSSLDGAAVIYLTQ